MVSNIMYRMASIYQVLFGDSKKKKQLEEKPEHSQKVKELLEKTKDISTVVKRPRIPTES
jgi:hypothetical protein